MLMEIATPFDSMVSDRFRLNAVRKLKANLTDKVWLWADVPGAANDAGKVTAIAKVIASGVNKGVMPTWKGRLSPQQIKLLTVYVHELGGGK